jgi:hypothetical protein
MSELRGKMRRNALDILHHDSRRVEDVAIDALQNVASGRAFRLARDEISIVDVAVAVGHKSHGFAAKLEPGGHGMKRFATAIWRFAHGQSFSG